MGEHHTIAVQWLGICGRCGHSSPETRDNEEEAMQDAEHCPCDEVPEVLR
jgi:hypothetical protein